VGELLDALDRTAAGPVRDRVLLRHPLQPFDARNLVPGELGCPQPFSFDTAALDGARAARRPRVPVGDLVADPLPPLPRADVALADLQAFLAHPVRAFLRARLDVSAPLEAEEVLDHIPISLDGLQKWAVGDRVLAAALAGADPGTSTRAERLRGVLPPGRLGQRTLDDVVEVVRPLVLGTRPLREARQRTLDVTVDLGDGRRLTGTVGPVFGNRLVTVTYSTLAAKHRLRAWVDLLALSAGHPDESWTAHTVGRAGGRPAGRGRSKVARALAGPVDHRAREWLRDLVDLYDRGLREPLPLPTKTACAYAEAARDQRRGSPVDPLSKAEREWVTDRFDNGFPKEDADPAHERAFGEAAPLDRLLGPPRDDERWHDEPHRLGQYALRLWTPLLDAERVEPL
jgi:exodeoxyribonuclease V gamma subunit